MPSLFPFFQKKYQLLLAAGLLASACTYDKGQGAATPCGLTAAAPATYTADVLPILQAHCLRCHNEANYLNVGGGQNLADFPFLQNYARTGILTRAVKWDNNTIEAVRMPRPTGTRLSDCDVARIESWIAAGANNN